MTLVAETTPHSVTEHSVAASRFASVLVAAVGLAVLIGWLRDLPGLTSLYLPGPILKTNAALCLACGAIANLLLISSRSARRRWRIAGYVMAAVPTTLGAFTLSEHIVGWDLGIDQMLATEQAGALATTSPNRMGPPGSTVNLLLGVALFLRDSASARRRALSQLLALLACGIAFLPLMGYAYGFTGLYAIAEYTGISLVNAMALLVLALAVQAGRPDTGLASLFCREDEVGVFARRMLPAAVLLPFGIGWVLARQFGAGHVDAPFAISTMALVLIVLMAGVIWRTGRQLVLSLDARAATERALAESERTLRETDQQKTEFLATLSHELRNPLAPIRFAVELLKGPSASAESARQTIERQVQHLTRLIDDLLDLTRITRDKLELHVRPSELRHLVNDAVNAVSSEIKRARHKLEIDLPPQPVWLNVDPDRVVQMLVNLLMNATRYSEPGGRIRVATTVADGDVTIHVRDSGHGIAAVDLDRVFERFVQVGETRHGGLGIGLALVKALAELHGGSVRARSAGRGKGSEFRLRLPRAAAPDAGAAVGDDHPLPSLRILVVDDNRDAADMLSRVMTASGHTVRVAYDGEEALRQALAFNPQVGFLDIGMPEMNGYELAARLRANPQLRDLFLVAITGWGQVEDRQRAMSAGFDAHLTKPADPVEIAKLLAARFQDVEPAEAPRS
jgi:signal transduction histidine kinase/ActR/RegA family two-component response regulator